MSERAADVFVTVDPEVVKRFERFERAVRNDGRYPVEAYVFLNEGLRETVERIHGTRADERPQHVGGRELCEGLRDYAIRRWGALAGLVLLRWNIRSTRDFGEMVFLLVRIGLLRKQDSDRIEDFDDVFSFPTAFSHYLIDLNASRLRESAH